MLLDGRYRVVKHLGSGGMASVLLCEDERLGRLVAVKRLHADSPADVEHRFAREAKLGASLNHPNLVSVYDTATDDEGVLIVLEYVEGVPLSRELKRGPLTPDRVGRMARELGAALDHAHAQGVVHRDVKPANVLLRVDGVTKLVDLGIATAADGTRITRSGTVLGTAAYMAPEQLEGGEAGPPADVYAMAAVCFEALSGARPRPGRTPMEIAHAIASGPAPNLLEHWPAAPRAAAAALRRGMARDPEDRHSSAGELAAELASALEEPPTLPRRRLQRRGAAPTALAAAGAGEAAPARGAARSGTAGTAVGRAPARPGSGGGAAARPGSTMGAGDAAAPSEYRARRRLPAIGLAAVLVALAAAIAIAALASGGGDDDPREARSGSGAARQERAAAGGEAERSQREERRARRERRERRQQRADAAPTPAPAPAPQPSEPAEEPREPVEQPVSADPSSGAELNDQGFGLMNSGRYEEAIPVLERAVASFPAGTDDINYAYALFNLGKSLRLAGRPEEAIPILERRLQIPDQTAIVQRELDAARRDAG